MYLVSQCSRCFISANVFVKLVTNTLDPKTFDANKEIKK